MLPAGSRVITHKHTCSCCCCWFYLCVQLRRCHGGAHSRCPPLLPSCCRLQIRQVSSQAWEPTLRSKQPVGGGGGGGGEKSCSRRHRRGGGGGGGVASVGRCVPYRHDNRLRGSRLLPRFRRLTLHSGYDGWSDSAPKNQEGPSCRLPACLGRGRHPAAKMWSCTHEKTTLVTWLSATKGAKSTKSWTMFEEIWDGIVFNSSDLHVRWFLFPPPEVLRNLCGYVLIYLLIIRTKVSFSSGV